MQEYGLVPATGERLPDNEAGRCDRCLEFVASRLVNISSRERVFLCQTCRENPKFLIHAKEANFLATLSQRREAVRREEAAKRHEAAALKRASAVALRAQRAESRRTAEKPAGL